jgi:hypothetical protein
MSRARDFADLAGSADAGGLTGRNLIINGAMQVAQRSQSRTGRVTSAYYTCDRWKQFINNMGSWTIQQSTTAPDGFSNSLRLACTTADASPAAGDYIIVGQILEGQDLQHLKKGTSGALSVTLSFWVRSNKTGTYHIELNDVDNGRTAGAAYTISSADTWEHKSITISGDTSGAFGNDNGGSLEVLWWLGGGTDFTSGTTVNAPWQTRSGNFINIAPSNVNLADSTSNEWYITGVQLEVGSATPFEHRSFADEYNRCLRYTYVPRNDSTSGSDGSTIATGYCQTGSVGVYFVEFPVPMRDIPSLTTISTADSLEQAYHNAAVTSHNVTAMSYVATISGNQKACFTIGSASFSGGEGAHCRYAKGVFGDGTSKDNIIVFSAEL